MERKEVLALGERVQSGERLSIKECARLLKTKWLTELGASADWLTRVIHPDAGKECTFVIDVNINYTNVCVTRCEFCAFHRSAKDRDAYVRGKEEMLASIAQLVKGRGTQVLLQGGHNPGIKFDYYLDLVREIKKRFPVHVHSFSPSEIWFFSRNYGMDVESVLRELVNAGLDSLPGGGAEMLVDRIRKRVSPHKASAREWLEVMRIAHEMGLPTTATMMYGMGETPRDRAEHLLRIRELQDETLGFTAFIPWSYQPDGTRLGGSRASAIDYLRVVAVSRLMLDNVENIQAGWLTEGGDMAQLALSFGANDFGGVITKEEVVKAAGGKHHLSLDEILRLIRASGRSPIQRDTYYRRIRKFE